MNENTEHWQESWTLFVRENFQVWSRVETRYKKRWEQKEKVVKWTVQSVTDYVVCINNGSENIWLYYDEIISVKKGKDASQSLSQETDERFKRMQKILETACRSIKKLYQPDGTEIHTWDTLILEQDIFWKNGDSIRMVRKWTDVKVHDINERYVDFCYDDDWALRTIRLGKNKNREIDYKNHDPRKLFEEIWYHASFLWFDTNWNLLSVWDNITLPFDTELSWCFWHDRIIATQWTVAKVIEIWTWTIRLSFEQTSLWGTHHDVSCIIFWKDADTWRIMLKKAS